MRISIPKIFLFLLVAAACIDIHGAVAKFIRNRRQKRWRAKNKGKTAIVINATTPHGQALTLDLAKKGLSVTITGKHEECLAIFQSSLRKEHYNVDVICSKDKTAGELMALIDEETKQKCAVCIVCQRIDCTWYELDERELVQAALELREKYGTHIGFAVHCRGALVPESTEATFCRELTSIRPKIHLYVFGDSEDVSNTNGVARTSLFTPERVACATFLDTFIFNKAAIVYDNTGTASSSKLKY